MSETLGDRFSKEAREQSIANGTPIGYIYNDGRGKHHFINPGDTVAINLTPVDYIPVYLHPQK